MTSKTCITKSAYGCLYQMLPKDLAFIILDYLRVPQITHKSTYNLVLHEMKHWSSFIDNDKSFIHYWSDNYRHLKNCDACLKTHERWINDQERILSGREMVYGNNE